MNLRGSFMKKIIALILLAGLSSGCALLQDEMMKSAEKVQDGVDVYCKASQDNRAEFRAEVNPTPDGNEIEVRCQGDS